MNLLLGAAVSRLALRGCPSRAEPNIDADVGYGKRSSFSKRLALRSALLRHLTRWGARGCELESRRPDQ